MRKWTYSWASSEGFRHEGEILAPSKDEAYQMLRQQGIHPIRVTERIVPVVRRGLRGLRRRDWFLIGSLLAVVSLVLAVALASTPIVRSVGVRKAEPTDKTAALSEDEISRRLIASGVSEQEVRKFFEDRRRIEAEYRKAILLRVESGAMKDSEAAEIFNSTHQNSLLHSDKESSKYPIDTRMGNVLQ